MKRFLKYCAYAVVAVVVLVGGAAIVVPMVVDPNDYREEIARKAEELTGRKVEISGPLQMTLLPWLGVETGEISMGTKAAIVVVTAIVTGHMTSSAPLTAARSGGSPSSTCR